MSKVSSDSFPTLLACFGLGLLAARQNLVAALSCVWCRLIRVVVLLSLVRCFTLAGCRVTVGSIAERRLPRVSDRSLRSKRS